LNILCAPINQRVLQQPLERPGDPLLHAATALFIILGVISISPTPKARAAKPA
jgi:hypothetical protein